MISTAVSYVLSHYGVIISFLSGIIAHSKLPAVWSKIKSFFTTVETDVKKVL